MTGTANRKIVKGIIVAVVIVAAIALLVVSRQPDKAEDLSNTVYDQGKVVASIHDYIVQETGVDYSSSEIAERILSSCVYKNGTMYCLIQLPYEKIEPYEPAGTGEIIPGVDVAKVVDIHKDKDKGNDGGYLCGSYAPGVVMDSKDSVADNELLPSIQMAFPPTEEDIYFVVTKIFDGQYSAYWNGEKLALNPSGIVGTFTISEDPLPTTVVPKPFVMLEENGQGGGAAA